jgi:uncharacterized lipoprotein YajG
VAVYWIVLMEACRSRPRTSRATLTVLMASADAIVPTATTSATSQTWRSTGAIAVGADAAEVEISVGT